MRSLKMVALLVALNTYAWILPQEASAQQNGVSFGVFYNELSPYGQWVDYPNYGYVWIPSAGPDFAPYSSNGYWIWTEYGWTWVSGYSWGWAPFHYGRWDYDDSYGWFWVPDNEWGPSWVNWRRADGYYGWAPMRPGISLSVSFGNTYTMPNDRWRFVRDRDFSRTDINHYYINRTNNVTIIKNSSVINRTYVDQNRHSTYVSGPDRADVQKITGRTIHPVIIHDNEKPGQNLKNGQLQIYRPQVQMNDANGRRPAPSKVVNLKDVKRPSERNAANTIPNINPANNSRQKVQPAQPARVTPAINNRQKVQPAQPASATPAINNRQKVQPAQPASATPAINSRQKIQPARPTNVTPATNNRQKVQPARSVNPPKKVQQTQSRDVKPSNGRGNTKQPQNVNPPKDNRMAQPSQPAANQEEKEKKGR
jgi:hypothetical protein